MSDGEPPIVGFYTSRRARAPNSSEARKIVMAAMHGEPRVAEIFLLGQGAGLHPKTDVQEMHVIPWWRTILPWRKPGLAFYQEDSERELLVADISPLKAAFAGNPVSFLS